MPFKIGHYCAIFLLFSWMAHINALSWFGQHGHWLVVVHYSIEKMLNT
jgi:hypothetical protein